MSELFQAVDDGRTFALFIAGLCAAFAVACLLPESERWRRWLCIVFSHTEKGGIHLANCFWCGRCGEILWRLRK